MDKSICGCEVSETLHENAYSTVYRGKRHSDGAPVVLKILDTKSSSPEQISAFQHEYALLNHLDLDGVVRAYGLEKSQDRWVMVLEDISGDSLDHVVRRRRLSYRECVELALKLVDIVGAVHQRQVIHKDINPSNVIMRGVDGRIQLIDFGVASQLSREDTSFSSPGVLEGSLPYMAPEQTGRMNRPVDYRADFYSLGVTLFELLTGQRPFAVKEPLELIHCHIARTPPSPRDIDPDIPIPLADIVLTLMAKAADDRYQSVQGIRSDLQTCLARLRSGEAIGEFPLARADRPEIFRLPQTLYGREQEADAILRAFERACDDGATMLLVSGYSGIGKSALIQEVYRPVTARRGYFAAGKFGQYQNNVPYAALIQAFRALVSQILTESRERVAVWAETLTSALRGNVPVLVEVCPELTLVVGEEESPPITLPPMDARNRFHQTVRQFISAFATPEHPLCLFFDDLQWADTDSLKLIEEVMHSAAAAPLCLIGAYRDSEVGETHPLRLTVKELANQGVSAEQLALGPLHQSDVEALIRDTLAVDNAEAGPLATLLVAKTAGNPFFLRVFLRSLHDSGLIKYTADGWSWDLQHLREQAVTDNVVDLIAGRVQDLPSATQRVLEWAACLGNVFDIATLAVVGECAHEQIVRDIWPAIERELILPLDRAHSVVAMTQRGPVGRCRFAHDRIQQAVMSLVPQQSQPRLHWDVGRRLLAASGDQVQGQQLFEIVGHLNQGRHAIDTATERDRLAVLNLRAATQALKSAAAQPALGYARSGIALISGESDDDRGDIAPVSAGESAWQASYEHTRDLHAVAANAAFMCGDLETLDQLVQTALTHSHSAVDSVAFWKLQGQVHYAQQRVTQAIQTYVQILHELGISLPEEPGDEDRVRAMQHIADMLGDRDIETLFDIPVCVDPTSRIAMEILETLLLMTYTANSGLFPIVICRLMSLSLEFGNTHYSCMGYIFYGCLLSFERQFDRAYRFGQLALRLANRFDNKPNLSLVYMYNSVQLAHRKRPLYELTPQLTDAYFYGVEAGSPFQAACSGATVCINRFLAGDELAGLTEDIVKYTAVVEQYRQPLVLNWLQPYEQAAINLQTDVADPCKLAGHAYDEDTRVPAAIAATDLAAMCNFHYCKALICYLFGDFEQAAASAVANEAYRSVMMTALWCGPLLFLDSLCRLAVYERSTASEQRAIITAVDANLDMLRAWQEQCPRSVDHKMMLIRAEHARVLGRESEARAAFEKAVELTRESGYLHELAIAYELAGRFHLACGQHKLAQYYLRDAHHAYLRWGAMTKAKAMERSYPNMLPRVATGSLSSVSLATARASDWNSDVLDLISVLDASRTISSEIELQQLLVRLMESMIESAGAQSGYLILKRDDTWLAYVDKQASSDTASMLGGIPISDLVDAEGPGRRHLSESVIHYVARTQQSVVLEDAANSPRFSRDTYIATHQIKSLLCVPLIRQTKTLGVLYLENNLIKGSFTADRLRILELLSAQAVISLENALLYDTLEQKVSARTQELAQKNRELEQTLERLRDTQSRLIVQERLASLGALTAGIAHELRNPLNFVDNFSRVIEKRVREFELRMPDWVDRLDRRSVDYVSKSLAALAVSASKVTEHTKRMDGIIRSMLEHSRGGKGERRPTDFNEVVKNYVNLAHHGLRARDASFNIAIDMDLDPSMGEIPLVQQEIGRLCLNLIDNACYAIRAKQKAHGERGYMPTVHISTRDLGHAVELRIRDNGIGIPPRIRDQIFNPFFTTKHTGEGSGLGLSLSREIVTQGYGGTIDVHSEEGEFTEFVATLPK